MTKAPIGLITSVHTANNGLTAILQKEKGHMVSLVGVYGTVGLRVPHTGGNFLCKALKLDTDSRNSVPESRGSCMSCQGSVFHTTRDPRPNGEALNFEVLFADNLLRHIVLSIDLLLVAMMRGRVL